MEKQKPPLPMGSEGSANQSSGQTEYYSNQSGRATSADPSFVFHVRQYVPDADGLELERRVNLIKARDWAAKLRGQYDSHLASNLCCEAHEIAGQFVFDERATEPRLHLALMACRRLVGAAMAIENLDWEPVP
jgi:hypothetical protein